MLKFADSNPKILLRCVAQREFHPELPFLSRVLAQNKRGMITCLEIMIAALGTALELVQRGLHFVLLGGPCDHN